MDVRKILEIIKCPYCPNENLALEKDHLSCNKCENSFPIIEGVPVLLKKDRLCGQEKQQVEWFDKHYSQFPKEEYKLENWRLSMLNRIFGVPFKKEVKTYLDIGCGATGYTIIEAAKRNNWFSVGADISIKAMVRAKNLAKNQGVEDMTAFLVCSAENLPFKSNSLDYISAVSLLEHLNDDKKAIRSLSTILKKEGHIYICVPNTYKRMWPFLWPVYLYLDRKIGHKRHYAVENLTKKMKADTTFEPEKVFYNGHLIKLCQLVFEKFNLIDTQKWWFMENKDINENNMGIQLNAIYKKGNLKKTVLLINPPIYFSDTLPYALDVSVPPLGILYLASYINKYSTDITAAVMDVAVDNISLKEICEKISGIKPFVIGISSMTPQLQGCVELAGFIKNNIPNPPKIFLGGPHISADYDFINRFSSIFDYAITGEAEKTFLDSINKLAQGQDIPKIQAGEIIDDLDKIPFPDKGLINRNIYSEYESMIFSRGCPYGCYYCSRPSISKRVRYRSVNNLIDEIKYVYAFCRGKIDFQDDTFSIDKNRVIELCNAIIKSNLGIEWRCNTRIDLVDDALLFLMKKAGCGLIHFGIESGNENVRAGIVNKGGFSNKDVCDVIKLCNEIGIKVAGYFMIGHPGETREDLEDTKKIIFNSGINLLGLSIPTPFPGSKLYEIAEEKGIVNEKIIDKFAKKELGEGYVGNYPVLVSEQITKEYLFDVMKSINRKFYINFNTFWDKFKSDIFSFSKICRDAKDLLSLILKGISSRKPYLHKTAGK